jgi:hypothetical protein
MRNKLTPMEVCEALIGNPEVVGQLAGFGPKAGYSWRYASAWRDAGDVGSARTMRRLLEGARARGIPLTAEHLIWGADATEIEALLAQSKVAAE